MGFARRLMRRIDWAMFRGALGFIPARASAPLGGWIAFDLLQQRIPAVGNPAPNHAQMARFAHLRPLFPLRMRLPHADIAQSSLQITKQRPRQSAKWSQIRLLHRHTGDYRSSAALACKSFD
jgi:hypothetical protein